MSHRRLSRIYISKQPHQSPSDVEINSIFLNKLDVIRSRPRIKSVIVKDVYKKRQHCDCGISKLNNYKHLVNCHKSNTHMLLRQYTILMRTLRKNAP